MRFFAAQNRWQSPISASLAQGDWRKRQASSPIAPSDTRQSRSGSVRQQSSWEGRPFTYGRSYNAKLSRHRFSPKPTSIAISISLPKNKPRCQRGDVRGVAGQKAPTKRKTTQTKQFFNDEAAALRKNHVVRRCLPFVVTRFATPL